MSLRYRDAPLDTCLHQEQTWKSACIHLDRGRIRERDHRLNATVDDFERGKLTAISAAKSDLMRAVDAADGAHDFIEIRRSNLYLFSQWTYTFEVTVKKG